MGDAPQSTGNMFSPVPWGVGSAPMNDTSGWTPAFQYPGQYQSGAGPGQANANQWSAPWGSGNVLTGQIGQPGMSPTWWPQTLPFPQTLPWQMPPYGSVPPPGQGAQPGPPWNNWPYYTQPNSQTGSLAPGGSLPPPPGVEPAAWQQWMQQYIPFLAPGKLPPTSLGPALPPASTNGQTQTPGGMLAPGATTPTGTTTGTTTPVTMPTTYQGWLDSGLVPHQYEDGVYLSTADQVKNPTVLPGNTGYNWQTSFGYVDGMPSPFNTRSMGNKNFLNTYTVDQLTALGISPEVAALGSQPLKAHPDSTGGAGKPYAVNPYNEFATSGSSTTIGGPISLTPEEWQQFNNTPSGLRGYELAKMLPEPLKPKGDLAAATAAYNQYKAAVDRNPTDQFLRQQLTLANDAVMTATYGPMWTAVKGIGPQNPNGMAFLRGSLGTVEPEVARPMTKLELAQSYGYGSHNGLSPDWANIQQTLRGAGWDPNETWFDPKEDWDLPEGLTEAQIKQKTQRLNDLLLSITPDKDKRKSAPAYKPKPRPEPKAPKVFDIQNPKPQQTRQQRYKDTIDYQQAEKERLAKYNKKYGF
jgi:hypothetical protein